MHNKPVPFFGQMGKTDFSYHTDAEMPDVMNVCLTVKRNKIHTVQVVQVQVHCRHHGSSAY